MTRYRWRSIDGKDVKIDFKMGNDWDDRVRILQDIYQTMPPFDPEMLKSVFGVDMAGTEEERYGTRAAEPTMIKCPGCGVDMEAVHFKPFAANGNFCPKCIREKERRENEVNIELEGNDEGDAFFVSTEVNEKAMGPSRFGPGVFPKMGLKVTRKELEYLVTEGAKMLEWKAGKDLSLNPSNLPTRADLVNAVQNAMDTHPIAKEDRTFARFLSAIETSRSYSAWLPEEHRVGADRDLKFIERRMEELLMFRRFIKSFVAKFRSRPGAAHAATEMFMNVMNFVRMIKETTGIDLEGSDET